MTSYKRGKISPSQLFCIVFVSRLVVCLTYIQSVTIGDFAFDLLLSFILAWLLTIIASLPVFCCLQKGKNVLNNKLLSVFYGIYFLVGASVTISRFSYFATARMNPKMSMAIFIFIGFLAICYGAYLGIESLARFGSFCAVLLVIAVGLVVLCNIKSFNPLNFYPLYQNKGKSFWLGTLLFAANSMEPPLLFCLAPLTNGNVKKPYLLGISSAFGVIFLLLFFSLGVLGSNGNLQPFPIYSFFQMASAFDIARLDMLHTSFWILAMFLKAGVLVFGTSICTKRFTHKSKIVALSCGGFAISFVINMIVGTNIVNVSKPFEVISFTVLCIVLPTAYCFLGGKQNA